MGVPLATYSFGDALLTVLEFAILFLWIWVAVGVVFDIFRSRDLSNGGKALWILFIIVIPYIGVLAYLIVRGHTLHEHQEHDRAEAQAFQRFEASGGAAAPSSGGVDELAKLAELHDRGKLSDDEFEKAKSKLLT
jgi:Phospholipase_D-nuclease N-terminal/Short C-terminal domain